MTEPIKRYEITEAVCFERGAYGYAEPDPNGEWCRYEPRFDEPQLSREEVDLIEWAWSWVTNNTVMRGAIVTSRLGKLRQLITRLRAQPQASPWVPCSERMPEQSDSDFWLLPHCWVTDGETVEQGWWDGTCWLDVVGAEMRLNVTHWAPIIRPEPPK